jgi:hypothetical protein
MKCLKTTSASHRQRSRRSFLQSSAGALILTAIGKGTASQAAQGIATPDGAALPSKERLFAFDTHYSKSEILSLYTKDTAPGFRATEVRARDSVLFYWDPEKKQLINPFNLKADDKTKPGNYTLKVEVLSFHPSSADNSSIWNDLSNQVQLTFATKAADQSGNIYTWLTMAAIQIGNEFLAGKDQKLLPFSDNNQLTNFQASDQITIADGQVSLRFGIAGQKKDTFWTWLIGLFTTAANSPIVGMLPIPKLAATAVDAFGKLLDQAQKSDKLVQALNGKLLQFRIYDGTSSAPFLLRPGYWVLLDAVTAKKYFDKDSNISGLILDVPGQLYEMVNTKDQPVDTTYCVFSLLIPQVKV